MKSITRKTLKLFPKSLVLLGCILLFTQCADFWSEKSKTKNIKEAVVAVVKEKAKDVKIKDLADTVMVAKLEKEVVEATEKEVVEATEKLEVGSGEFDQATLEKLKEVVETPAKKVKTAPKPAAKEVKPEAQKPAKVEPKTVAAEAGMAKEAANMVKVTEKVVAPKQEAPVTKEENAPAQETATDETKTVAAETSKVKEAASVAKEAEVVEAPKAEESTPVAEEKKEVAPAPVAEAFEYPKHVFAGGISTGEDWSGFGVQGSYAYRLGKYYSIGLQGNAFLNDSKYHGDRCLYLLVRGQFHLLPLWSENTKFDLYAGAAVGACYDNSELEAKSILYLGAAYDFNKRWGIFAEAGSIGALGLRLKF